MQSFLNKIGKTAGAAANKAGSKANELLEIGKLKGKISTEKQNIKAAKAAIGDYCYDLFQHHISDIVNIASPSSGIVVGAAVKFLIGFQTLGGAEVQLSTAVGAK